MKDGDESVYWSIWQRMSGSHIAVSPGKVLKRGSFVCYCSEGRDQARRLAKEFDLDAQGRSRRYSSGFIPVGVTTGEKEHK